jgi:hypothetical protein
MVRISRTVMFQSFRFSDRWRAASLERSASKEANMFKSMTLATGGLMLTLGLGAGCAEMESAPKASPGTSGAPAEEPDRAAAEAQDHSAIAASINADLARLQALQVITAPTILLDLPAEATACYGSPCEDSWVEPFWAEHARQAKRLHQFADIAEATAPTVARGAHDKSEAEEAIATLDALHLIAGAALVEAAPANNPECYHVPCLSDVAAADETTGLHVAQLFAVVDAAKRSGL